MPEPVGSNPAPNPGTSVEDMQRQSADLLAKQTAINMQTERSTAATNMEKSRHDALMAVVSNFKS
jgi:hypothetical protein